jgi:hypothetical protein
MTIRLSNTLPDALIHNAPASLHFGDFVLSMFLFASGMSLVFFDKKRAGKKMTEYVLDVVERTGKLVLIWFFLSPFSAGAFLGMDELVLSAILFIPSLIAVRFSEKTIVAIALIPIIAYFMLQYSGALPDFTKSYLGGYAAAPFYLPVMLAGVVAGKKIDDVEKLLVVSVVAALVLLVIVPPYKMSASPSFMVLSIVVSLAVLGLVKKVNWKALEYLGQNPIKYWVLMFVVMVIPVSLYAIGTGIGMPMKLSWESAVLVSILAVGLLYFISIAIGKLSEKIKTRIKCISTN